MSSVWNHFTDEAKRALWNAIYEARRFGRTETEPIHLMSALLQRPNETVARVLDVAYLPLAALRDEIEPLLEDGDADVEQPPMNPSLKRSLQFSYEEAFELNDRFYGTDHLLLGLLRQEDAQGGTTFLNLGLELTQIRAVVSAIRGGRNPEPVTIRPATPPRTHPFPWDHYDESTQQVLFEANDRIQSDGPDATAIHLLQLLHVLLTCGDPTVEGALHNLGVTQDEICREIERQRAWTRSASDLFLSPTGKRLADWSSREANALGSPTIAPAHLLLGVMQTDSISAGPLLRKFGVTPRRLREQLRQNSA